MVTPLHSTIDRGEHENYLFLPLYGNTENPLLTVPTPRINSHSEKAKGQLCFIFSVVKHFLERFKAKG